VPAETGKRGLHRDRIAAAHGVDEERAAVELIFETRALPGGEACVDHFEQLALHRLRSVIAAGEAVLDEFERTHDLVWLEVGGRAGVGRGGQRRAKRQQTCEAGPDHPPTSSRISMRRLEAASGSALSFSSRAAWPATVVMRSSSRPPRTSM